MKKSLIIGATFVIIAAFILTAITSFALNESKTEDSKDPVYDEYFSSEKVFVNDCKGFGYDNCYFYSDDSAVYMVDIKLRSEKKIYNASVSECYADREYLYCIDGNNIIRIEIKSGKAALFLTESNDVSCLYASDNLLYYVVGGKYICRYFIPSNKRDVLVEDTDIAYIKPFSNYYIEWSNRTEKWSAYINSDLYDENEFSLTGHYSGYDEDDGFVIYKSFDWKNKDVCEITNIHYEFETRSSDVSTSVTINNKTVPLSSYPTTHYFSISGASPCSCHSTCGNTYNSCDCKTGINRSGGYCKQCVGFAYTAYRTIWGVTGTGSSFTSESSGLSNVSNSTTGLNQLTSFFSNLDIGSMMIATKRDGSGQHAFVLTNYVSAVNIVWLYDANGTGNADCDIAHRAFSMQEILTKYSSFGWVFEAP